LTTCFDVYAKCVEAIESGELIESVSTQDKEFHFQNWFIHRLNSLNLDFDEPGRNTYPDFRLVKFPEGYELKGLATPGRDKTYDSNSQIPTGIHHGRTIYYVFGRYPKDRTTKEFPIIDFVICHGDFLNVTYDYVHENKSVKGFGSYGDIMIRDRKMYVVPTPFVLTTGTVGNKTLIVPEHYPTDARFVRVGELTRVESDQLVVGYSFDLNTNVISANQVANRNAGKKHIFYAYRLRTQAGKSVEMASKSADEVMAEVDQTAD